MSDPLTEWLPTLPARAISNESVENFLRKARSESNTHEFKLKDAERIADVVSALANTYGGILIVGVPDKWTGDFSTLSDVSEDTETRIIDGLTERLEPSSWFPEVVRVSVRTHPLLVLKVDASEAPRPVLSAGRAFIKREKRTVRANWFDLRSMYNSDERGVSAVAPLLSARNLISPADVFRLLPAGSSQPDIVWRMVAGSPVWRSQIRIEANADVRDATLTRLLGTPIENWLREHADVNELICDAKWVEVAPSYSGSASFGLAVEGGRKNDRGLRAYVHVQLDVSSKPVGVSGGGIAATLTLMFWTSALAEDNSIKETRVIQRGNLAKYLRRFDIDAVGQILYSLVATAEVVVKGASEALLDYPHGELVGPQGWVAGPLDKLWDFNNVRARRPAANALGTHRGLGPPDHFPATDHEREELVADWLSEALYAAGFVPETPVWAAQPKYK